MVGPIKTRLACDRCHGQKLRCPKQAGSRVCTRCERAGVACLFSPIGGAGGGFRNGNGIGVSPAGTGFPVSSLFGGMAADMNLDNGDWSMPFANGTNGVDNGSNGSNGSNGNNSTPGFSFDDLMQMAAAEGPMFTSDAANLFAGVTAGVTPGMTPGTAVPTAVNSAETAGSTAPTTANGNSPNDGSTTPTSTTLAQRLSKLVADADLLYGALPNEAAMHAPLEAGSGGDGDGNGTSLDGDAPFLAFLDRAHYSPAKFAKKEFLERVFDITQRLSNAYAEAAPKKVVSNGSGDSEETCDADNCLHSVPLPGNLSTLEAAFLESGLSKKAAASTPQTVDLTVAALLVAAHTRLLDVLVRIVHGIFACYRLRVATSTLDDAEMQLPDLTIGGSFMPPKGSAALVHAFLLRHLLDSLQGGVERYWGRLKEVDINDKNDSTLHDRELHIASLQFGVLKERHDATLHHLVAVGTDLASTGLIK